MKRNNTRQSHAVRVSGVVAVCMLLLGTTAVIGAEEGDAMLLKWALTVKSSDSNREISTNKNRIELSEYDSFKFYLLPAKDTYIYFYHYSSDAKLIVLLDGNTTVSAGRFATDGWIMIPPERLIRFQLESGQTGAEKFYLIASRKRLKPLESLTAEMTSVTDDTSDIQKRLLDEIHRLSKKPIEQSDAIEKPAPIAGVIKGPDNTAFEIAGIDLFVKTISISLRREKAEGN